MSDTSALSLSVLGPLDIRVGDSTVVLRGGRQRILLHCLIINRRVVLPVDVLADRLWGEEAPKDAANAIHQLVSQIRTRLGDPAKSALVTAPAGYCLDIADEAVDAWHLENLVADALTRTRTNRAADVRAAYRSADQAIRLWRGEPYAESARHQWAIADRVRLRDTYLQAQECRVEALLMLGQPREAALQAQSLAAAYPLRERFHAQLSLALYRSGRQSDALEVHRAVRELLARELALDPSAELQALERAILNQDPRLEWAPPQGLEEARASAPSPPATTPAEFCPTPHDVEEPPLPMIGRAPDMAIAEGRLEEAPVYTITGPPGVGKSRMALALAARTTRDTWLVDLQSAEPGRVAQLVAGTLGLQLGTADAPLPRLAAALRQSRGLLVLDNCEVVAQDVHNLVAVLRRRCPSLRVLVTSRRPLGLAGEVVHRLAPLEVPDATETSPDILQSEAVTLFVQRARAVAVDFEPTEADLVELAHVVRSLDGIPLAIEIAAAHVDVMSVAAIRQRVAQHIDSLTAASFSIPRRSPSLTAAIGASAAQLEPAEHEMLLALSVFPDRFDVGAAAAVGAVTEVEALTILASLVRHSLLVYDSAYRLLAPVRAYASANLSLADLEILRRRHAMWISGEAWRVWTSSQGLHHRQRPSELRPLMQDARAALRWAIRRREVEPAARIAAGFSWAWTLYGHTEEGFGWLTAVKDLLDELGPESAEDSGSRATVLKTLALLANPLGKLELAREASYEASSLFLRAGDRSAAASCMLNIVIATWALGDLQESFKAAEQAAELTSDDPGGWNHVAALVLRARTALDAADPRSAELLQQAFLAAQSVGDAHLLGLALACQARAMLIEGDHTTAELVAAEAARVWARIEYQEGEMMALNLISRAVLGHKRTQSATAAATRALEVAYRTNHIGGICEALESLALAAADSGEREKAAYLFAVADTHRRAAATPVPAADEPHLTRVRHAVRATLGSARRLVDARASLTTLPELVSQLLTYPDLV